MTTATSSVNGNDIFAWEKAISRSWNDFDIDSDTSTAARQQKQLAAQKVQKQKLNKQIHVQQHGSAVADGDSHSSNNSVIIEKRMIRYCYLILDLSDAMSINSDFKPTRKFAMLEVVCSFIQSFFDQNPISQLGIIVTHNKIAEKLTELSGNPADQQQRLRHYIENHNEGADDDNNDSMDTDSGPRLTTGGEISIQNALLVAQSTLQQIPSYGSRECILIHAALYSVDPDDL